MLAVGVEPPAVVVVALERLPVALRDPRSQAAVLREGHDVRAVVARDLRGRVGRAVVDHEHVGVGQLGARVLEHGRQRRLLVPGGDEDQRPGHRGEPTLRGERVLGPRRKCKVAPWPTNDNDDTYLDRPNRRKASSKATKAIVAFLLVVSAVIVLIISLGGWNTLEGAKPLQIAYILLYLVMAFLVMRWNRGVLPLAAALAIVLLIFAAVSGPAWFDRDKTGLTEPPLSSDLLGLLSLILVPVQILLIAFSMRGFQQAWNVEVERTRDERDDYDRGGGQPAPAAA